MFSKINVREIFSNATNFPVACVTRAFQGGAAVAFGIAAYESAKKVIAVSAQMLVDFTTIGAENPIFGRIANINNVIHLEPISGRLFNLAVIGLLCYSATRIAYSYARKFCQVQPQSQPVAPAPNGETPDAGKKFA